MFIDKTPKVNKFYSRPHSKKNKQDRQLFFFCSPPFLCNLLSVFIGMNRQGVKEKLEEGLYALSRVIYYINEKMQFVTLARELNFVKLFLLLQKIRFGERVIFRFEITGENLEVDIPRYVIFNELKKIIYFGSNETGFPGRILLSFKLNKDGKFIIKANIDNKEVIRIIKIQNQK